MHSVMEFGCLNICVQRIWRIRNRNVFSEFDVDDRDGSPKPEIIGVTFRKTTFDCGEYMKIILICDRRLSFKL